MSAKNYCRLTHKKTHGGEQTPQQLVLIDIIGPTKFFLVKSIGRPIGWCKRTVKQALSEDLIYMENPTLWDLLQHCDSGCRPVICLP